MEPTQEILEKMTWLHSQGLEPNIYWDKEAPHGYGFVNKDYAEKELLEQIKQNKILPYYSESHLWSLLPEEIKTKAYTYEFESSIGRIGYYTGGIEPHWLEWEEIGDLHTALLDLTVWCVKNGYLKAEVRQ